MVFRITMSGFGAGGNNFTQAFDWLGVTGLLGSEKYQRLEGLDGEARKI